ncbi:MAG: N-acetyltransferase [Candidatus Latescibacterota bacterium]
METETIRVIRAAQIEDVPQMAQIINEQAKKGLMLPRSLSRIYEHLRDYVVAVADGGIVGCGALQVTWEDLGEIRSLAIAEGHRREGVGSKIVASLLKEAWTIGLGRVFVLTYRMDFFAQLGFREVSKELLPHKVWRDCFDCIKYPECDEHAMILERI